MRAVLGFLSAAVVAPIVGLLTDGRALPALGLGGHAIIGQHDHGGNAVLIQQRQIPLEALHKAVMLFFPNNEFRNQPHGVEAGFLHELQLFLGGINELFSSTGLNMTVVMASSFAPVPITILAYNKLVKKFGLGVGYKFILSIFSLGMVILLLCYKLLAISPDNMTLVTIIAILGGIFISFSLGALFSITYIVPTNLAQRQMAENSN